MSEPVVDFPIYDADNHMYETPEAFTKFLPPEYAGLIKYVEVKGRTKIAVKNVISDYIPNPTFEVVARPGAQQDYFKHGNPDGKSRREILGEPMRSIDAYFAPEPRLALMDELGIDRAIMWPTLASLLEERLSDDPRATHAVVHAFNQWMYEQWTFNYEDRIYPTPVITLADRRAGDRRAGVGREPRRADRADPARRRCPASKERARSPLPEFDPFWQKVVEADVAVGMHSSDDGMTKYINVWEGPAAASTRRSTQGARSRTRSATSTAGSSTRCSRPSATGCSPGSRRCACCRSRTARCGSPAARAARVARTRMNPACSTKSPSTVFKRNVWVHPFHEDDPLRHRPAHRRRSRALRLRLPAPRRARAPAELRRPAARLPPRRHRSHHGRQPRRRPEDRRLSARAVG